MRVHEADLETGVCGGAGGWLDREQVREWYSGNSGVPGGDAIRATARGCGSCSTPFFAGTPYQRRGEPIALEYDASGIASLDLSITHEDAFASVAAAAEITFGNRGSASRCSRSRAAPAC